MKLGNVGCMGALFEFISTADAKHFQPMPPNFGIIPVFTEKIRNKRERYQAYAIGSLNAINQLVI